ncbi:hypothetical protein U1Q18_018002 [Sarracenia purpurea var. burkii]
MFFAGAENDEVRRHSCFQIDQGKNFTYTFQDLQPPTHSAEHLRVSLFRASQSSEFQRSFLGIMVLRASVQAAKREGEGDLSPPASSARLGWMFEDR